MQDKLIKQMDFIRETDAMKGILRVNLMLDGSRNEDDAQHSWHAALMALVLSEYAQRGVDVDRAIRMLLVHDLVEIDAGDTYAYDETGYEDKAQREQKAAQRIFGLLPDGQADRMRALWEEFEACQTPSAKYAGAIDRLQPLWGNFWMDGTVWEKNNITLDKVLKRNEVTKEALPGIWETVEAMLMEAKRRGYLR